MTTKHTANAQTVKSQTRVKPSTPADNFTQRVEIARERAGLKKFQLEIVAGLPKGYASRLTSGGDGTTRPTDAMIRKLAAALDVSAQWLATGEGSAASTTPAPQEERPNLDSAAATLHGTLPAGVVADVRAAMSIFPDLSETTWICVLSDIARARRVAK